MIQKIEAFILCCDNCNEEFQNPDNDFSIYILESDLIEAAVNENDWIAQDGKHYCGDCYLVDEHSNIILATFLEKISNSDKK